MVRWFVCSYLDRRILIWTPVLLLFLLINGILILHLILTICEVTLNNTLKMSSQKNSSSLPSQKGRTWPHVSGPTTIVVFYIIKKNWDASSFFLDDYIRLTDDDSRDISSDTSSWHLINLHDITQEINHVSCFHYRQNRSSSSRSILMYWIIPSTSIDGRYHDQKRYGHDRNICHNSDERLKISNKS